MIAVDINFAPREQEMILLVETVRGEVKYFGRKNKHEKSACEICPGEVYGRQRSSWVLTDEAKAKAKQPDCYSKSGYEGASE